MSKKEITILPEDLDPDRLILTKKDIVEYLDSIIDRWKKNLGANYKAIVSAYGMKGYILVTDEDTIKKVWTEILNGFNELLMKNAMARAKGENPDWYKIQEEIKKKIKEG